MMKHLRLVVSVIAGLMVLTLLVEGIEFFLITSISGKDRDYLQNNQDFYFAARNTPPILAAKLVYTLIAAGIGGYLAALIAGPAARGAIFILIGVQTASLLWGGFLSEWASTAPLWLWLALILVTSSGLYLGYRVRTAKNGTAEGKIP